MSGRPRGEIRQALLQAAERIAGDQGEVTWREAAAASQVGWAAAKQTFKDMARAGELVAVGEKRVPGICRPMRTFRPQRRGGWVTGGVSLGDVLAGWVKG